jgi:phosphoglycerol transferase MdoB-like AlkP superfamily enzyme
MDRTKHYETTIHGESGSFNLRSKQVLQPFTHTKMHSPISRAKPGKLSNWAVILFWVGAIFVTVSVQAGKPDIVVFLSDDHGQLDSTPYGATDVRTPNMQRLADAGLVFDRAFVASPACAPSRAAMLTGLMPARNGAEANHQYKRNEVRSLPEVLRQMGYQTAAFGKGGPRQE